jgi:hypothetical protein
MKWLLCLALIGCAHQQQQSPAPQRCRSAVEVFPQGMAPQRAYRVIGPVQVRVYQNQLTAAEQSLMREACDLGADAIILQPHDAEINASPLDPGPGRAAMQTQTYVGATAIAYTDGAAPAQ